MKEQIINAKKLKETVNVVIGRKHYDKIFILTDTTTRKLCLPLIDVEDSVTITIGTSDSHKTYETLNDVLRQLVKHGASRHSLIINLGGGVVTDLGGFTAAIFKRGIDYVNIPTTLLAMVDASVGGKTGINFGGLKNEIGVFKAPVSVLINTVFLKTLDNENFLSGYAEVLKHALLDSNDLWKRTIAMINMLAPDSSNALPVNIDEHLQQLVYENVKVKTRYVDEDPLEEGIRKALNFGHTFGHAIESFSFEHPSSEVPQLSHGYAVAYGMICELYLSTVKFGFPVEKMRQTVSFIKENYGALAVECKDYDRLVELMHHDKKN